MISRYLHKISEPAIRMSIYLLLIICAVSPTIALPKTSFYNAIQWLDWNQTVEPMGWRLVGFGPSGFDQLSCGEPTSLGCSLFFGADRFKLGTEFSYVSFHEMRHLIQFVGTGTSLYGPGNFPTYHLYLLERAQGLKIPEGETFIAKVELSARPRQDLRFHLDLVGGWNFIEPINESIRDHSLFYQIRSTYAQWKVGGMIISIGRQPIFWGQSGIGPLLISDNGPSMDAIRLTSSPVLMPWILKYFGPTKSEFFLSRLESDRFLPNEYMFGFRLGFKPLYNLEIDMGAAYQFGGSGAPETSVSDFIIEVLGGRRETGTGVHDVVNGLNRSAVLDVRWDIASRPIPITFYTEQFLEDCCGSFKEIVAKAYSYVYGVSALSSSNISQATKLRLEYASTADAVYYHGNRVSGWTRNGGLIGSPVGRDSQRLAFYLSKPFFKKPRIIFDFDVWIQESQKSGAKTRESIREYFVSFSPEKLLGSSSTIEYHFDALSFLSMNAGILGSWNKDSETGRSDLDWTLSLNYHMSWALK